VENLPLYPTYPIQTLRDLLHEATNRYRDRIALQSKVDGVYRPLTYVQLRESVQALATALMGLGLSKEDRVAILSENRTEWSVAYLAAVCSGLVAVPIDKELKAEEVQHILKFSGAAAAICGGDSLNLFQHRRKELPALKHLVSMEKEKGSGDIDYPALLATGGKALGEGDRRFADLLVEPDDLAAIIFTSGTTGMSKGVMLSHGNLAAQVVATSQFILIREGILLSVLPLHHTYECSGGFLTALYQGCTICHAENLRRIPDNLRETGASVLLGVPLLFETFYRRIEDGIREKGLRRFLIAKKLTSLSEPFLGRRAHRRIFREIHDKLGGNMRLFISGGAAIDPAVSKGFRELGFDFIQGYGMTEASPIIAVNRVDCFKDEAAGLPLPGLEVKIVEGEILVRGHSVMQGYYRNESATRETIVDGWLYTGDLGFFDEDGFLHISGRKKAVIVTSNGKNVHPEEVEAVLSRSPFILESLVWGGPEEDPAKVEVQAIIVPRIETFDQEFGPGNYDEQVVSDTVGKEVKRCCKNIATFKRVKKFSLRMEQFEKTTTRKVKRYLYTGKPKPVAGP
jgi:long-chain acyl-CoA synthetase